MSIKLNYLINKESFEQNSKIFSADILNVVNNLQINDLIEKIRFVEIFKKPEKFTFSSKILFTQHQMYLDIRTQSKKDTLILLDKIIPILENECIHQINHTVNNNNKNNYNLITNIHDITYFNAFYEEPITLIAQPDHVNTVKAQNIRIFFSGATIKPDFTSKIENSVLLFDKKILIDFLNQILVKKLKNTINHQNISTDSITNLQKNYSRNKL